MSLNFRTIEAFKAVMEAGTISKAADRMLITQPAVSKLISAFEASVPVPVFKREGGRLVPTPEARQLYAEVDRVFSGISELDRFAHSLADRTRGHVSIGVLPALSIGAVQQFVSAFLTERPDVQISLHNYMATMPFLSGDVPEPIGNTHFVPVDSHSSDTQDGDHAHAVTRDEF